MPKPLEPLRGVIAPMLTPFNNDLTIALDLFAGHAQHLLQTGCVGLAPFGTTGEALSLGIEERMAALDHFVERGIPPKALIPGTGLTNLPDTITLTRHAVDHGCAGALVLPPFYYKDVSDEGLFAYFAGLAERVAAADLRIYLYHIPPVAQVGLSIDLVQRLHTTFPAQLSVWSGDDRWRNVRPPFVALPDAVGRQLRDRLERELQFAPLPGASV